MGAWFLYRNVTQLLSSTSNVFVPLVDRKKPGLSTKSCKKYIDNFQYNGRFDEFFKHSVLDRNNFDDTNSATRTTKSVNLYDFELTLHQNAATYLELPAVTPATFPVLLLLVKLGGIANLTSTSSNSS